MTLSAAVMAHPERRGFVDQLLPAVGLDPDHVVWDEKQDRWHTGRRAMLAYDPDATHHLVLQDDAVVPRDLMAGVERALEHIPDDVVMCLYAGRTKRFWDDLGRRGVRVGQSVSWLVANQVHWGVGIVVPTAMIPDLVAWGDTQTHVGNYDKRIGRWCQARGVGVWYPWPSLVDHRESPSLVAGRSHRGRRAQRFIGQATSALSQSLGGQALHIPTGRTVPRSDEPLRLSVSIMAHPVRDTQVAELQGQLGREVPVSWDREGPPSADTERRWRTGRRAWEMHDPGADWHLVLQDDALVCPDLVVGLEKALQWAPDRTIVQPYVGTKRPNHQMVAAKVAAASDLDASWLSMRSLMWGVAIVVPVPQIPEMLTWCDASERRTWAYDKRISRYFCDQLRWRTYYPWPSLVDHREGPSICGHSYGGRRAHRMWERSALERDWSGPVVTDSSRPTGRNLSVKSPRVRMTHPRGRGIRLIPEHDVARWTSRGWQVAEEPPEDDSSPQSAPEPEAEAAATPGDAGLADAIRDVKESADIVLKVGDDADDASPTDAAEASEAPDNAAVRAWAGENGIDVSPRGKVPQRVIDAYEAAISDP